MTDDINQVLSLGDKFLIDFAAVLKLHENGSFEEFFDELFNSRKVIVISGAFRIYQDIIRKHTDTNGKQIHTAISQMLERFRREGRLTENPNLSLQSSISSFSEDRSVCLLLLEHSFSVERIRDMGVPAYFSVCLIGDKRFRAYPDLRTFMNNELSYSVHPVSRSTDYLDANFHCNVGDKVYDSQGMPILLTEKISTGAEGIVFRTADPNRVAKIYHKGVITPLRWRKLMRMTQKGISADGICWPTQLLYTFNKVPVGFLMQTGAGHTLGTVFDGPDAIISRFPDWGRQDVVRVTLKVLEKIIYLHLHGILIGDIQMKNMMMKDPDHIFVIDMDSVQIEDMPCPVGTEEYTSPELWDFSFSDVLRRPIHEDFSCAILVFSILFCGQHPYAQRFGRETLREEIIEKSFPYSDNAEDESLVPIGGYDKIWDALPDRLRTMFVDAFRKGTRFEPVEWYSALLEYLKELNEGAYEDREAYKLFPYTDLTIRDNDSEKPKSYKKSIREAIIQTRSDGAELDSPIRMSSTENMLYNNQRTSTESRLREDRTFSRGVVTSIREAETNTERNPGIRNQADFTLKSSHSNHESQSRKNRLTNLIQKIGIFMKRNRTILILGLILLISIVIMIVISMVYD